MNTQGDKAKISGTNDDDDTAYVVITDKKGGTVYFEGEVTKGQAITFEAPGSKGFGSETLINVYDSAADLGGKPQQVINLHTSCSVPLVIGESFGSVELAGFGFRDDGGSMVTFGQTEAVGDAGVVYEITGGADAALFTVDPDSGEVSFIDPPDYEAPQDAGADNTYEVEVTAFRVDADGVKTGEVCEITPLEICVQDDGTVEPGSLSGTYFCDEDRDGADDGAAAGDADIPGRTVTLLNADGSPALDIDGNPVAPVQTDAEGNYRFDNLAAGDYVVEFEPTEGKEFIAKDAGTDETDDSDVNPASGRTDPVTVNAGAETRDVDAGVQYIAPTPVDDTGVTCADETLKVDLLGNDPAGLAVVSISDDDETVGVNGSLTLASGATVTLNADGSVIYDGTVAQSDLLLGDSEIESFSYTVTDGLAQASADVDIKVYGASYNLETVASILPESIRFENTPLTPDLPEDAFTITLSGSGDAQFDGKVFEAAYCIDANLDFQNNVKVNATLAVATYENAIASGFSELAASNMDSITWILNQNFDDQPNGEGGTYTDLEVQAAIWELTNGDDFLFGPGGLVGDGPQGNQANVDEIVVRAQTEGEGFVAGDGDLVGLLLLPDAGQPETDQPYILAFAPDCVCDDFVFV